MSYFSKLPQLVISDLQNDQKEIIITNIFARSAFLREILDNTAIFYEYEVKENETPEIIAHKLYGSVERFWIILLFNKLMNPIYDFPLNQQQLESLILSKYGYTPEDAQIITHHYERRIRRDVLLNGIVQSSNTETTVISYYEEDPDTGLAVPTPYLPGTYDEPFEYESTTELIEDGTSVVTTYSHVNVSVYAYEHEENEKRRKIRLLDARYVSSVENELQRTMNE